MKRTLLLLLLLVFTLFKTFAQFTGTSVKIMNGTSQFRAPVTISTSYEFSLTSTAPPNGAFNIDIDPVNSRMIIYIIPSSTSLSAFNLDFVFSGGDFGQLNSISKNTALTTSPASTLSTSILNSTTIRLTNSATLPSTGNGGYVVWDFSASASSTAPTMTPGTIAAICQGSTSASLSYTATGSPDKYSIDWNAAANTAGLADVTDATLPATPISITVPSNLAAGTYTGTVNVKAGSTAGTAQNISLTVNALPTITLGSISSVSTSATSFSLPYTATTGSPDKYSIATGTTALSGFTTVTDAALSTSPLTISLPTSKSAGTYDFNLTVKNGTTGCVSRVVPFTLTIASASTAPVVSTTSVSTFNATTATLGGNVTSDGGASVTEKGIVWSTATNPTTANNKVSIGNGTGSFSKNFVGPFPPNTTIYVKAYAINSKGTSYGSEVSFKTNALAGTSAVYDFETGSGAYTGFETPTFTATNTASSSSITVTAATDGVYKSSVAGQPTSYVGDEALYFGWVDQATAFTVTSQNNKTFDLTSFYLTNESDGPRDFKISTTKGSITITLPANLIANFIDVSGHANAAYFKGITSFTVGMMNNQSGFMEFDHLVIENITALNSAPVNTVVPAITGTAKVGSALTSGTGTWTDADGDIPTYTYQWYRADDNSGTNSAAVSGATSSSYTLTTAEAHKYIRVTVTANDGKGGTATANSVWTAITNSAPVNTVVPAITGTAAVGNALTSGTGTWSDADGDTRTYTYQWYRADDNAGTNAVSISGATSSSYTLTTSDAHKYLRVRVTANDGFGGSVIANSAWTSINNSIPVNTVSPSITGSYTVGSQLTSSSGTWTDADNDALSYTYQWYRSTSSTGTSEAAISGATASTYTLTSTDLAKYIRVVVTASDGNGGSQTATTNRTVVTANNTAPTNSVVPAITGTAKVGNALTSGTGTWTDAESDPITYTYQWYRADDNSGTNSAAISGATSSSYTLTIADAHKYLRVAVTANDGNGGTASVNSAWTAITNSAPVNTVVPAITGTATVGNALTSGTGTWSDADGDTRTYTYQWYRADDNAGTNATAISLATGSSYTLTTSDAHKYLRVAVTANDGNGGTASAYSTWTAITNTAPVNTVVPAITGIAKVGNALTSGTGTWTDADGDTRTYTYQWYRADDNAGTNSAAISGATSSSYTLTTSDGHRFLRVAVTANDGNGGTASANSTWTAISNTVPVNTVVPAITGTAKVGNALTSGTGTWTDADGDSPTYTYQWYRADDNAGTNSSAISGATSSSYTLTVADAHKYVRVSVTANDGNGGTASANSTWTAIANTAPVNTVVPAITGTAKVGNALTSGTGTWTDADGDTRTYTYQWYRADDNAGTNSAAISGATSSSYTLVSADANKYVRVSVTANDGNGGTASANSTWTAVSNTAPVNTVVPAITGTAKVGNALTSGTGTWTDADGDSPTYTYQWYRADDNAGTNSSAIFGAASSSYTLIVADAHKYVRVAVTANDGNGGIVTANSAWTAIANSAPVNTVVPAITGTATIGNSLTSGTGTWADVDSDSPTYTYQWYRADDNAGTNSAAISAATSSSYTLVSADVNKYVRVAVTANDGNGGIITANSAWKAVNNVPSVTAITRVGTSPTNATTVGFTVTFSENVTGVDAGDFVITTTQTAAGTVASVSGSGANYTVNVNSISGAGTLRLDLKSSGTGIVNSSSTPIGGGYTSGEAYTIDAVAPSVTSVNVPSNNTYKIGANLDFTVNFDEAVTVSTTGGTPYLGVTLNTGGTVNAAYISGSGTTALLFRYMVASGNADADGVALASGITSNGGSLKDAAGNNATLTLNSVGSTAAVLVDGIVPTLSAVTIASNNATATLAKTGNTITLNITASEAIGTPTVTIAGQSASVSGSGSSYTATYTTTGSTSEGLVAFNISFSDLAGNAGTAVSSTSNSSAVTFDKTAPAVPSGFTASSGDTQNTLSWTANSEGDFKSYKIYGGTSASPTTLLQTITPPTVTYTHTGLTNGTAYYYRITAIDNAGNESSYSSDATATPKASQTITFNALTAKTYGDADFDAGATISSGLTINYASSNTAVATIVSGKIHIVGQGTTTITASQAGSAAYLAASDKTQSLTVNKKSLTVSLNSTPAISKIYDASTAATLAAANYSLTGVVGTDAVTVTGTATYDTKTVGTGKTITANTFVLAGADKDKYSLSTTSATTTGAITARTLSLALNTTPSITKVYDGSTSATLASANYSLTGVQGSDAVSVSGTATYDTKAVGTGKIITANTFVLAGADKDNYNLTTTSANTTGSITAKPITVALNASPAITKVYDGSTSATLASGNYILTGVETGDGVSVSGTVTYDTKSVGTGKTVTANSLVLAGAQKDNYSLTTTSATTTGAITTKPITVALNATPAITKVYDGSSSATLALGNYTLTGVETGDVVTVSGTATYDSKSVGTGKTVTANTFVLAGAQKDNYSLSTTSATTTGAITVKPITVALNATPAITKVYDGSTSATLASGNYTLTGVETGDVVTVSGTATYDTKSVGTGKTVTANTFVLAGAQKDNYSLNTTSATTTGAITAKSITVALNATPAITKVYDGSTSATLASGNYTLTGVEAGDVVTVSGTAAYDTKSVGTGKTVTANAFVLAGAQKDNYSLTTTSATTTGAITVKSITLALNAIPAITKVYDGLTSATLASGNYTLTGVETGDVVSVSGTATYDNKSFGSGKTVTANAFVLAGAQRDNYSLSTTSATTTGAITAKPITLALNATPVITKVYDGSTSATLASGNYTLTGVEAGDVVTVSGATTYDTKLVGTGKTVTANSFVLAGAQKDNYSLTTNSATTTGAITAKPITLALNATPAITKVYDGLTTATLASGNYTLTGIEAGDVVTVGGTASYDNKNAGTGKTVTANGFVLAGAQKDNYSLTTTSATTTGTIAAKALTITADNKEKFQGLALPAFTASYSGFIGGETSSILTMQPGFATTATVNSPQGTYPITVGGAVAANYSITYVAGVLTVKPGSPTNITLAATTLYENAPVGTPVGTLSSTSDDPSATFTYTLVSGAGDTDNTSFKISGNQLQTNAVLNFESKASYSVLVRSTTQYGLSLDKQLTITLSNVNEQPTINNINAQTICYTTAQQSVGLSGISAGEDAAQTTTVSVSSSNNSLFKALNVGQAANGNAVLTYEVSNGASGTATVNVMVMDNGGTANGGVNVIVKSFLLTVNSLPVPTISTNKGVTTISKGDVLVLKADGGTQFQWANANGVQSGQNTQNLTIRPSVTTTYRVTVTNASGCSEVKEITIAVNEDYAMLNGSNLLSPNGDGINDVLKIDNLDMYPNNEVKIFDRAGRLLYSKKDYSKDGEWTGTLNGLPLAEDTYYYVVDFGTGNPKYKGFITIIRD